MREMIEVLLRQIVDKFNERARTDPQLKEELAGFERAVLLRLKDGQEFSFRISGGQAIDFQDKPIPHPEIVIETDAETVEKLMSKEMRIMKAIATRKLRINASLEDMLRMRKFF